MVYTMVYTVVLQKSVRVNEKSGGFLGLLENYIQFTILLTQSHLPGPTRFIPRRVLLRDPACHVGHRGQDPL
jgi:hypothetical protein